MLFSAPMVRALLAGKKTQTRRTIKWRGRNGFPHSFDHAIVDNPAGVQRLLVPYNHPDEADLEWGESGYHRHYGPADPGDRIWVKETFAHALPGGYDAREDGGAYWYRATDEGEVDGPWKPSIFMPRSASRITLHVTSVKVERLQDITPDDAAEEGAVCDMSARTFVDHYRNIWERINGPGSWAGNPWVVALTFSVEHANIDAGRLAA